MDEKEPLAGDAVPIAPDGTVAPFWASLTQDGAVVDLGDFRVSLGRPRFGARVCQHNDIAVCLPERRVWCRQCEATIDAFDALVSLMKQISAINKQLRRREELVALAEETNRHRLAARAVEETLHKGGFACPHCQAGILAEDLTGRRLRRVSRELELQRRRKSDPS